MRENNGTVQSVAELSDISALLTKMDSMQAQLDEMTKQLNSSSLNGIVSKSDAVEGSDMIDAKRQKYLDMHPYAIYPCKNGKYYTKLPDETKESGRRQIERKTKEEVENVVIAYWEEKQKNPTLQEVFDEWNQHRLQLKKIGDATSLRNQQIFKRFFSDGFGAKKIKDTEPYEIQDFLEEQIAKYDLTSQSFCNLKTIVRGMLRRAKKLKYISYNVEELMNELDVSDTSFKCSTYEDEEEVFYDEEVDAIINYCIDRSNTDLLCVGVALMFATGMRVGEAVALKHDDIDCENHLIYIRRTESRFKNSENKYDYKVKDYLLHNRNNKSCR